MTQILRLVPPSRPDLATAEYLAEYDAIEVAPYWYALFRDVFSSASGPTADDELPDDEFKKVYGTLYRRADELEAFFRLGGLLVAWLYEPAFLESDRGGRADTHWWFMRHISFPGKWPGVEVFGQPGHGTGIAVLEPTHPLGSYLEMRDGYIARLSPYLRAYPGLTVLAENRAGDPVAVEFRVGRGSIALVPPPQTDEQRKSLAEAIASSVGGSSGRSRTWIVAEEREAEERQGQILERLRQEQRATDELLQAIGHVKSAVLNERHVRRAIDYVESAQRVQNALDRRIGQLHKLVELLEDYTDAGERGLAQVLGVDAARVKRLKKLANRPSHDIRHASTDEPSSPAASEISDAMETGRLLVEAFVEMRYRASRQADALPGATQETSESAPPTAR